MIFSGKWLTKTVRKPTTYITSFISEDSTNLYMEKVIRVVNHIFPEIELYTKENDEGSHRHIQSKQSLSKDKVAKLTKVIFTISKEFKNEH